MSKSVGSHTPKTLSAEFKVGLTFLISLGLIAGFGWYLGVINPFAEEDYLYIGYNFAGGIEVGSPVRVMGIKVGKVHAIDFDSNQKTPSGEEVKLRVKLSISKKAWPTVRKDSRFFINLAGVIGEKYIEVSPGSNDQPTYKANDFIRGEDPPRIDQLISQSYGLAGKIIEIVQKNEGSVTDTLDKMNNLVKNLNKTLVLLDKTTKDKQFMEIVNNITALTSDMTILTARLRGPEAAKTIDLMHRLIWRLDKLDEKSIREFLQKEGIRARMF